MKRFINCIWGLLKNLVEIFHELPINNKLNYLELIILNFSHIKMHLLTSLSSGASPYGFTYFFCRVCLNCRLIFNFGEFIFENLLDSKLFYLDLLWLFYSLSCFFKLYFEFCNLLPISDIWVVLRGFWNEQTLLSNTYLWCAIIFRISQLL